MFEKHAYVFHESGGVCRIVDICKAPLENMPSNRDYYVLRPLQDDNSMIYVPTDSDRIFLRRLLTREESEALLAQIASVEIIKEENSKLLRNRYVEAMRTHEPIEWVRVIKTVEARMVLLASRSQRLSETERSHMERAKRHLKGELSVSLEISESDAERLLVDRMKNLA